MDTSYNCVKFTTHTTASNVFLSTVPGVFLTVRRSKQPRFFDAQWQQRVINKRRVWGWGRLAPIIPHEIDHNLQM